MYKAYKGHSKTLSKNRYLVGLFTARVFDLQAPHAVEWGKKGSRGKVVGGYGVPLYGNNIIREISYTDHSNPLDERVIGINDHTFTLHRFVAIVAANYGFTIFEDGVLDELGLDLRGRRYDEYIAYRAARTTWGSIYKSLRVGDVHSRQCDVDHRAGRDLRHLDGLLHAAYTSHRMNICYHHARENAGHWCCGCEIMTYAGGNVSTFDTHEYFPAIDELYPQGINEAHDEDYLRELKETDPFEFLPPLTAPWELEEDVGEVYDSDDDELESLAEPQADAEPQAEQVDPQESTGKRKHSRYSLRNIRPRR